MTCTSHICDYCGLTFRGSGYSPDDGKHFCCIGCYLARSIVHADGEEGLLAFASVRLGIGAFLAMNVMMLSLVLYFDSSGLGASTVRSLHLALLLLSTPAMVILGIPFMKSGFRELINHRLGSDILVATGSTAAYAVSTWHVLKGSGHIYFDTASMLLMIMTLGKLLEAAAKSRAASAVHDAVGLIPETAHIIRGTEEIEIRSDQVKAGDLVIVRPGGRIPVDGEIEDGSCLVDEAPFTGESSPRTCTRNAKVYAGSLDYDGLIKVRASADGTRSLIYRMKEMIAAGQEHRAKAERFSDRVSAVFMYVVFILAICAATYWGIIRHDAGRAGVSALAVMVIACPCALGLAVPMAVSIATGKAAQTGALIRSGAILERMSGIGKIFFDKTGTLTRSELRVADVKAVDGIDTDSLLSCAASLEAGSEHAIAKAVIQEALERGIETNPVTDFRAIPGYGVEGVIQIDGKPRMAAAGSMEFIVGMNTAFESPWDGKDERMTIYTGCEGQILGEIALEDSARSDARETLERLKAMGVDTAIISGDREEPTRRLAGELGIEDIRACCTPDMKAAVIRNECQITGGAVAMVGDGINDAPALSEAAVGIAAGCKTDLTRQSSDIILLGDDLLRIPWLLDLSRKTMRIIRQNLYWAFGYNSLAMSLAFMGFVHPLIAAVSMLISSITVIANSMRLLDIDIKDIAPKEMDGRYLTDNHPLGTAVTQPDTME